MKDWKQEKIEEFEEKFTHLNHFDERVMNGIYATNFTKDTPIIGQDADEVRLIKSFLLQALSEAEERGRNELLQAIRNWKLDRFTENEDQTIAHRQATTADDLLAYLISPK